MLECKGVKIHCCPIHVWKHGLFGYATGLSILSSCTNNETKDASNIKSKKISHDQEGSVMFSQINSLIIAEFKRMTNCFMDRDRK